MTVVSLPFLLIFCVATLALRSPFGHTHRLSLLAIASLIFGVLTLICLGPLAGIVAIICGHLAHSAIKKSGGVLGGGGMATAGLVLGYVGTVLSIVVLPEIGRAHV